MRRADRLLQILQILRRNRRPVTAAELSEELEVVPRTVYRDIVSLQSTGVPVRGETGIGYVLDDGYDLPPLMFTAEEVEAIVLGALLVTEKNDPELAKASQDVVAKVSAILPESLRDQVGRSALLVPQLRQNVAKDARHMPMLRKAVREYRMLDIGYRDLKGDPTRRRIWPLGLAYFFDATLVCAWCELRQDFRAFRVDRIVDCEMNEIRFNHQNGALLSQFLAQQFDNRGSAA